MALDAEKDNAISVKAMIKFVIQKELNKNIEERGLDNRKHNIIIYRVPEKKMDMVNNRKISDTSLC